MMTDQELEVLSQNLSRRIQDLRFKRGLTQASLAKLANVPRSTLANLESGTGNPSLISLAKISRALGTSIEVLLSSPKAVCKLIRAHQVKSILRSQGEVKIIKLLVDPIPSTEIDKIELNSGAKLKGAPHSSGTKEYLHCLEGEFNVVVSGESYHLEEGDVLAFPGETQHSYENSGKGKAVGLVVVVFVPAGA